MTTTMKRLPSIRRALADTSCTYLTHTVGLYPDGRLIVAHGYGSLDPSCVATASGSGSRDWPQMQRSLRRQVTEAQA